MLKSLITSEARIKLLLKFFLNSSSTGYLRQLSSEFGESTNNIRVELNKLSKAGMLISYREGRNKVYKANTEHPLFNDIRNIVFKSTGIDKVITDIINKLGDLQIAFIRGDYAEGKDNGLIDLVVVADNINKNELERVRAKTENLIQRKISVLVLSVKEFDKLKENFNKMPIFVLFKGVNI